MNDCPLDHSMGCAARLGWWTISGEAFLDALKRVQNGEAPDLVYAELYANSGHEHPGEETTP